MFFDKVHEPEEIQDLAEGTLLLSRASNGDKVAVARIDGVYHAVSDRCPHLGCSLAKARLEATTLTCHCHGSQFDVRTGELLGGPSKRAVSTYDVSVDADTVVISPQPVAERV